VWDTSFSHPELVLYPTGYNLIVCPEGYIVNIYLMGYRVAQEVSMSEAIRTPRQLGSLIHNERLRRGLSQQELANLAGTGQKTISRIETGHEGAKLDTLFRLLAVLQLEIRFTPRSVANSKSIGDVF
jgi:HTH-type transcriptional regulator / antitoxin HipB